MFQAVVVFSLLGGSSHAGAQELNFNLDATLGDTDGPGYLHGTPGKVALLPGGRFLVTTWGLQLPKLYSPAGAFVGELGAVGEGPGEYQAPVWASSISGDSVIVWDRRNVRLSLLGPELKFVRSFVVPSGAFFGMNVRWPHAVLNQSVPTPSRAGLPLHSVVFRDGSTEFDQSFGGDGQLRPRDAGALVVRMTRELDDGTYWSTPANRLSLVLRDSVGTELRTFDRRPAWLEATSTRPLGTPEEAPPARIEALLERNGNVWVFARVASEEWQTAWSGIEDGAREVRVSSILVPRLFDTLVEIYDGTTGGLVHSCVWMELVTEVLPDGRLVTFSQDDPGRAVLKIWSIQDSQAIREPAISRCGSSPPQPSGA